MWNSGSTPRVTSPGSWRRAADASTWSRLASRLPWVSMAAFGEPAVPLVKISDGEVVVVPLDHGDRLRRRAARRR